MELWKDCDQIIIMAITSEEKEVEKYLGSSGVTLSSSFFEA